MVTAGGGLGLLLAAGGLEGRSVYPPLLLGEKEERLGRKLTLNFKVKKITR